MLEKVNDQPLFSHEQISLVDHTVTYIELYNFLLLGLITSHNFN